MFAGNQPSSALHALQGILSVPEILWELFLGIYCTIWGFQARSPDPFPGAPDDGPARIVLDRAWFLPIKL